MTKLRWTWDQPLDVLRDVLDAGGVVAIPSESSYGLAVDPRCARGVDAIYDIKGRPADKALPIVVAGAQQLVDLGVPRSAPELAVAESFWPAPLSILLPLPRPIPATAGLSALAARVPAHPRLRELLSRLGHALTATSANLSDQAPVLDPRDLALLLAGHRTVVIDDGVLPGGPPSTLAAWPDGVLRVLRQGAFPAERLPRLLSEA